MTQFTIEQKHITIYPCAEPDRPVIYLNTFEKEGEQVLYVLREGGCPPFTLVSVSNLNWNYDMSPWEVRRSSKMPNLVREGRMII